MKPNTNKMWRIFCVLCALAAAVAFNSCYDDTDVRNSIDDLTGRVEDLEKFRDEVQSDISALNSIIEALRNDVTVDNIVDNGDGSYTINFSDGTSVTIADGTDGADGLTPPSITVVEDDGVYYWAYENADGTTDFILDGNGERIPVTAEAPQVRINPGTGNWEISTDGGQTWVDTGMPSAGGSGESIFASVSQDETSVTFVLRDGTQITVPKTTELNFSFNTDLQVLEVVYGESYTLDYTMSGAADVIISKPDGWKASIRSEGFVITAPVAENIYAETEGEVSVLLVASNGQSFTASIDVRAVEYAEPVFTLSSADEVLLGRGAGNTTITYTIENERAGGVVSATSDASWLSFNAETSGQVAVTVEANAGDAARIAAVTVTYTYNTDQTQSFEVVITQGIYDYETVATTLLSSAGYHGDEYSAQTGDMAYGIFLRDIDQNWTAGHNYYYLALQAGAPEDMSAIAPPVGTYTASATDGTNATGKFKLLKNGYYASTPYHTMAYVNGSTMCSITSGEVKVSRDGNTYTIDAVLTDTRQNTHHVVYTGEISLNDARENIEPEPDPDVISLLTQDLNLEWVARFNGQAYYWGDGRYVFEVQDQYSYEHIIKIELYTDAENTPSVAKGLPVGTYTIDDTKVPGTILAGTLDGTSLSGSWVYPYGTYSGNNYSRDAAPLVSGSLLIEGDAGSGFTCTLAANDDAGHKISATFTLECNEYSFIDLSWY